jgi:hypothetical protein
MTIKFISASVSIILIALYAFYLRAALFDVYPLSKDDLEVNDNNSPEEGQRIGRFLEAQGYQENVRSCAIRKIYLTTSRAERVLVPSEGDFLNVLLLRNSYEWPVKRGLEKLGLSDDQIDELRHSGELKFTASLQSCIGN